MRSVVATSLLSPVSGRRVSACRTAAVLGLAGLLAGLLAGAACPPQARAETKTFFVANQPDGYGIDECLASGATCGRPMASTFCRAREYEEVVSFRKAAREEMIRESGDAVCTPSGCIGFIAIECQR